MTVSAWLNWALAGQSLMLLVGYEWRAHRVGSREPQRMARYATARPRALSARPGYAIVAVQALRNSQMSATTSASTAALAVMGTVSLSGVTLVAGIEHWWRSDALHTLLLALLVLFASYMCSALAMRCFGHASFVMSMPVASPERQPFNAAAADHVHRTGKHYGWGLRLFIGGHRRRHRPPVGDAAGDAAAARRAAPLRPAGRPRGRVSGCGGRAATMLPTTTQETPR